MGTYLNGSFFGLIVVDDIINIDDIENNFKVKNDG